jgi:hypothetical protein
MAMGQHLAHRASSCPVPGKSHFPEASMLPALIDKRMAPYAAAIRPPFRPCVVARENIAFRCPNTGYTQTQNSERRKPRHLVPHPPLTSTALPPYHHLNPAPNPSSCYPSRPDPITVSLLEALA